MAGGAPDRKRQQCCRFTSPRAMFTAAAAAAAAAAVTTGRHRAQHPPLQVPEWPWRPCSCRPLWQLMHVSQSFGCSSDGGLSIARLARTAATWQPKPSCLCVTGTACHSLSSTAAAAVVPGAACSKKNLACQPGCQHVNSRQAPHMWCATLQDCWLAGRRPLLRQGRSSRRGGQGGRHRSRSRAYGGHALKHRQHSNCHGR